jgi:hypothetical protein
MAEGKVETKQFQHGEYTAFRFSLCEPSPDRSALPEGAIEAVAYGVEQIRGKSATQVSDESHEVSRVWRQANDGDELNIYLDSLSLEDYEEAIARAKRLRDELEVAWAE